MLHRGWLVRLALCLAVAVMAHLLLSHLGFNPTDDGFILAQSRRILAGQVPHRDFISIRPVGSPVLHTADLILGGDHAFLFSRFLYWIEAAVICWCWLEIAIRRAEVPPGLLGASPLIPLAFMLSTHAFPPMAWHTVDAILLASVGLLAAQRSSRGWRLAGYLLVGASVTCKQSFLPMLPLAVVICGDSRRAQAWVAVLLPGLAYVVVEYALGAGADMREQLFAHHRELLDSGVKRYVAAPAWPIGVIVGSVLGGAAWLGRSREPQATGIRLWCAWLGIIVLVATLASVGWTLDAGNFLFIDKMCFALLGCLCGLMLVCLPLPPVSRLLPAAALLAGLGWCSGISIGYQTPAHVAGPIAVMLLISCLGVFGGASRTRRIAMGAAAWIVVVVVAGHWWSARHDHIYREATAPLLTKRLDDVLPGGSGIMTNPNTFAVLADLRDAIARLNGRPYAVLVDVPGWWARSKQANPLPADWPQTIELCTELQQGRFSSRALAVRGRTVFIVQRVQMTVLADGIYQANDGNSYYGAASWIRHNFNRVGGSRFWDLYE